MIEFRNVSKRFGEKWVLRELCFQIGEREIVFLLGRSGAGKSVALKHLVGLIPCDAGEIWVDGQNITQLSEEEFFPVRRKCGMVFQFPALLDFLTVYENVAFGIGNPPTTAQQNEKEYLEQLLSLVGLTRDFFPKYPTQLSFGTQKRVSIARALASRPKYLLFDEPTTSLDPVHTELIHELITHLSRTLGLTAVVVSHNIASALRFADRLLILEAGQIIEEGTPEKIRRSHEPLVRDFLRCSLTA